MDGVRAVEGRRWPVAPRRDVPQLSGAEPPVHRRHRPEPAGGVPDAPAHVAEHVVRDIAAWVVRSRSMRSPSRRWPIGRCAIRLRLGSSGGPPSCRARRFFDVRRRPSRPWRASSGAASDGRARGADQVDEPLARVLAVLRPACGGRARRSPGRPRRSCGCRPARAAGARTSPASDGERSTSKRSWTAVETLLTFCPPGPTRGRSAPRAPSRQYERSSMSAHSQIARSSVIGHVIALALARHRAIAHRSSDVPHAGGDPVDGDQERLPQLRRRPTSSPRSRASSAIWTMLIGST